MPFRCLLQFVSLLVVPVVVSAIGSLALAVVCGLFLSFVFALPRSLPGLCLALALVCGLSSSFMLGLVLAVVCGLPWPLWPFAAMGWSWP